MRKFENITSSSITHPVNKTFKIYNSKFKIFALGVSACSMMSEDIIEISQSQAVGLSAVRGTLLQSLTREFVKLQVSSKR